MSIENVNKLLNTVIERMQLKNDAALAKALGFSAVVISKHRHGLMPIGATMILALHEYADMPVKEIKGILSGEVVA